MGRAIFLSTAQKWENNVSSKVGFVEIEAVTCDEGRNGRKKGGQ